MNKWWIVIAAAFLILGGIWFVRKVTVPPPGNRVNDMGRGHVTFREVEDTRYNSNPPTSGKHVQTWVKPGIYDKPQHDGELIHSLEHGYIIISYNCNVHLSAYGYILPGITKAYAHEEEGSSSADIGKPSEASGSAVNESNACSSLISQLTELANRKKLFKLVVVPRPNLDTTIALTAWTYIDKFDQFDAKRIEKFIDYYRDHGPEQTPD